MPPQVEVELRVRVLPYAHVEPGSTTLVVEPSLGGSDAAGSTQTRKKGHKRPQERLLFEAHEMVTYITNRQRMALAIEVAEVLPGLTLVVHLVPEAPKALRVAAEGDAGRGRRVRLDHRQRRGLIIRGIQQAEGEATLRFRLYGDQPLETLPPLDIRYHFVEE